MKQTTKATNVPPLRARENKLFAEAVQTRPAEIEFTGGTRRQGRKPLYHLVPLELLAAVGNTREEGDLKYEPGNWMQGGTAFFIDCLNHTIEHLMKTGDMESEEDMQTHLGHAATNIGFMLWAMKRGLLTRSHFGEAAVILREEFGGQ